MDPQNPSAINLETIVESSAHSLDPDEFLNELVTQYGGLAKLAKDFLKGVEESNAGSTVRVKAQLMIINMIQRKAEKDAERQALIKEMDGQELRNAVVDLMRKDLSVFRDVGKGIMKLNGRCPVCASTRKILAEEGLECSP